ncbi:PCP reductase family protein [Synechococcus sp. MIT S9508]|uniref:PCP reductase family protein n=1 Tax=Synechococcus sp. MIT S9508 TaxID=1801629 RepID=UPI0009ED3456
MRSRLNWSANAEQSLKEVPFFVRPAVRRRIESMAQECQLDCIDSAFYAEARAKFAKR